jgi:hypothetical protein
MKQGNLKKFCQNHWTLLYMYVPLWDEAGRTGELRPACSSEIKSRQVLEELLK